MTSRGYLTLTSPEGKKEFDTLTCVHCNSIIVLDAKKMPSGYCGNCHGVICKRCDEVGRCIPFEKLLDMAEGRAYRNSQLSKLGII